MTGKAHRETRASQHGSFDGAAEDDVLGQDTMRPTNPASKFELARAALTGSSKYDGPWANGYVWSQWLGDDATVTVADGGFVEISGGKPQSVVFAGTSGTLKLDHSIAFTGAVSGLTGADALDLADIHYGTDTKA